MSEPIKHQENPLNLALFPQPGIWQSVKDMLFPKPRLLDCIQIEVSSLCPGRCAYCPRAVHADTWQGRFMEASTFAKLWPLLEQTGRAHLQGWGEPLLHLRFFDFVALARRADCQVSTTTCGLRMDEDLALRLVKSGVDIVAFSLTGTNATSNASRVGVDFDAVCKAIECLQRIRRAQHGVHLELHLAYLLLANEMDALEALPTLVQSLGIHAVVVSTLDYIVAPGHEAWAFAPHEQEKIAQAHKVLCRVQGEIRQLGAEMHFALPTAKPSLCRENTQRTLYIDAKGLVSPCVYLNVPDNRLDARRTVFGDVALQNPVDIWKQEDFAHFRQSLLQEATVPGPCQSCAKRFEQP